MFGQQDDVFDRDKRAFDGTQLAHETLKRLLKLNRCAHNNKVASAAGLQTFVPGPGGEQVIWNPYKGGHSWPDGANEQVVRFLRQHTLGKPR